jgi:hypothetical protein
MENNEVKLTRLQRQFDDLTARYITILKSAGVSTDDINSLFEVLGVEDKLDLVVQHSDEYDENPKMLYDALLGNARKGAMFLAKQKREMERMEKKAYYLNELDTEEVNELVFGVYASAMMIQLCVFFRT